MSTFSQRLLEATTILPRVTNKDTKAMADAGFAVDLRAARPDLLVFRPTPGALRRGASPRDYVEIEVLGKQEYVVHADAQKLDGQELLISYKTFRTLSKAIEYVSQAVR